jgi:hypothetical protein
MQSGMQSEMQVTGKTLVEALAEEGGSRTHPALQSNATRFCKPDAPPGDDPPPEEFTLTLERARPNLEGWQPSFSFHRQTF